MSLKTYHYYMIGGFSLVVWVGAIVFALQVALKLTS